MGDLKSWAVEKVSSLYKHNDTLVEDRRWSESKFKDLHTLAKIETLNSFTLTTVPIQNWDSFSERIVKKLVRDGATYPESVLRDELAAVQDSRGSAHRQFYISLNYEFGGSQYMSCIKFAARKKRNGDIVIAYSLFGKRWVEQLNYALNRDFWEESPVPERMQAFLEHGANCGFIKALENKENAQALTDE